MASKPICQVTFTSCLWAKGTAQPAPTPSTLHRAQHLGFPVYPSPVTARNVFSVCLFIILFLFFLASPISCLTTLRNPLHHCPIWILIPPLANCEDLNLTSISLICERRYASQPGGGEDYLRTWLSSKPGPGWTQNIATLIPSLIRLGNWHRGG